MTSEVRPLRWGWFLLQFVMVTLAYLIAAMPPVLLLGQTNLGLALSTVGSSLGGIGMAWVWLKWDGAVGEAFNLKPPQNLPRTLMVAMGATLAVLVWFQFGSWLLTRLGMTPLDTKMIMDFVTASPGSLALWVLAVAWFAAGFGEELIWRGFLMDRLMRLKGISGRLWLAVVLQAAVFGLPHLYQGWAGVIVTGVVGLLFGWLRIRSNWNLWPLIIAHGLVDTISMCAGYLQAHGA